MLKTAKTLFLTLTVLTMCSVVFADAGKKQGQPVITDAHRVTMVENFNLRDATTYSFGDGCSDNNSGNDAAAWISIDVTDVGAITSLSLTGTYTVSESWDGEMRLVFGTTDVLYSFNIGSLSSWDNQEVTFDLSAYYAGVELNDTWWVRIQDSYDDFGGEGCNFSMAVEASNAPAVFFSEYAEGSSNNKYFEIYNGTDADIDLSDYLVLGNYNGNPFNDTLRFPANTTVTAGDVYVVAHEDAASDITAFADSLIENPYANGTSYIATFNGDDVRALVYISGTDTSIVDIIGTLDGDGDGVSGEGSEDDPGSGFDVAGVSNATKDYTIVRKNEVVGGNGGDWNGSAGTDSVSSEWFVNEKPTADYTPPTLGWHIDEPCALNAITFTLIDSYGDGWNGSTYTFTNDLGEVVATGGLESGAFQQDELCLADGVYGLVVGGGSYMGEVSWIVYDNTNQDTVATGGAPFDADVAINFTTVPGCTDPSALNYDANANLNDGSCYFEGDSCSLAITAISGETGNSATGAEQWFVYTTTMDGFLTATTCYAGQTEDTDVDVYDACDGTMVASSDDAGCGDITGGNNYASHVEFPIVAGETYYFFWDDTWGPGPFTWNLYETPPPAGPEDLVAVAGVEVVDLSWTPLVPDNATNGRSFSASKKIDGVSIEEHQLILLDKKVNTESIISHTRAELIERYASQSSSRDMDVYFTLYDTYGDGYSGAGLLSTEAGDTVAVFEGGNWGSESAYGPYTLVDGVYIVSFEQTSWQDETTWQVTDVDGSVIAEGGVATAVYFSIGDAPTPQADLAILDMWYDGWQDAVLMSVVNIGDIDAGSFLATYYIMNPTDTSCANDTYEAWSQVDGLAVGDTAITGIGGIQAYTGWGTFEMGALVDWACAIDESNETNNSITTNIAVANPLDGVVWNIYRDGAMLATAESFPDYSDTSVVGDTSYCYTVSQVLSDGTESTQSNEACATPIPAVNLPSPTDLLGTYANWEVSLTWTAPDLGGFGRSFSNNSMGEKIDDPSSYQIYNKSDYPDRSRQGGDTVDDATVIDAFPYYITGTTAGYTNDYDQVCPYTGSTAPDVVYSYTATSNGILDISLCGEGTNYDTKVYVFENAVDNMALTVDGLEACNDDECENSTTDYLSYLPGVVTTAGNTYYVVIDGYGGDAGDYELEILFMEDTPLLGYNVYRDSVVVAELPGDALGFVDMMDEDQIGVHSYFVTAEYEVYGESDPSNTVDVDVVFALVPPTNLVAETAGNDVFLSWDPVGGGPAGGPCDGSFMVLGSDPDLGDCYEDGTGYFWFVWEGGCLATTLYYNGAPDGMDLSSYGFTEGFYFYGFDPGTEDTFTMDFDDGTSATQTQTVDCVGTRSNEADPVLSFIVAPNTLTREFQGYNVYRDGQSIGTTDTTYFDDYDLDFDVTYSYYVTASYDEGESGPSNTVDVTPHNTPPSDFEMMSPGNQEVIVITRENIATSTVDFMWTQSSDADGDAVEYTWGWVQPGAWYGGDSVITSNTLSLSYQEIYDMITVQQDTTSWWWYVSASDGVDTTDAGPAPYYMTVNFDISPMLSIDGSAIPEVFALHQNYPNPFNPVTSIQFDIPEQSEVRMDIYNLMGQRVATLVNNTLEPGFHAVKWNGTNDFGKQLSSGMYIYRISANNFTSVKKLILMK